jgi:hypothetical protein
VLTGLVDLRSSATTSQLQVGRCTAHPSKQYCVALIQNAASVIHRQLPNIRYCSVLIQNTVSAIHRQLPNNRICRAQFRNAASVLHKQLPQVPENGNTWHQCCYKCICTVFLYTVYYTQCFIHCVSYIVYHTLRFIHHIFTPCVTVTPCFIHRVFTPCVLYIVYLHCVLYIVYYTPCFIHYALHNSLCKHGSRQVVHACRDAVTCGGALEECGGVQIFQA